MSPFKKLSNWRAAVSKCHFLFIFCPPSNAGPGFNSAQMVNYARKFCRGALNVPKIVLIQTDLGQPCRIFARNWPFARCWIPALLIGTNVCLQGTALHMQCGRHMLIVPLSLSVSLSPVNIDPEGFVYAEAEDKPCSSDQSFVAGSWGIFCLDRHSPLAALSITRLQGGAEKGCRCTC